MVNKRAVAVLVAVLVVALGLPLAPSTEPAGETSGRPRLGASVSGDWWTAAQQTIARSEYQITWQDHTYLPDLSAAYQAPNRTHNLRTYFTPNGIRVIPRTATGPSPEWEWGLHLVSYGYEGNLRPVATARLVAMGNRIEYRRGQLTEWYVNDERGLEQGFTLAAPPTKGAGTLEIDLVLKGTLTPTMAANAQSLELTTAGGVGILRYGVLQAHDSTGRALPAKMVLLPVSSDTGHLVRIIFDAAAAVYPVTVDPLSTSVNWSAESNQASAQFGFSVATAGDVNGDGYSDVIVGAPAYDNGQTDEGRVFVYHGSATGLATSPNWIAESNQAGAKFGASVATAGDVNGDGYSDVIVGASEYDNGQTNEGRAFVYHGSAVGLATSPNWTAESNQAGARFGVSVATAGDVNGDGYSDVIVGAPTYDNGETDEGRAFVYHGSAAGLATSPNWTAESDQAGGKFGVSVATAGDVNGDAYSDIIIGASGFDNGQTDEGRALVYHGSAAGLGTSSVWTNESNQAGALFGLPVATGGDINGDGYSDVIVGASEYDNGQTNEGRAFVYHGSATGLNAVPAWTAESNQTGARFAISVAVAGDVNGDGYSDVIVGAPQYDNGQTDEGRAFVYGGSAAGLSVASLWTAESNQTGARFGGSVAIAGDVNGDGYSDVIVGASQYDNGQTDEGRAFVYHGAPAGLNPAFGWSVESNRVYAGFGISVGTAGDVNGDGYSDVIVGAYGYDNGQVNQGRVFVYHGSPAGLKPSAAWSAKGSQAYAYFGASVATAGDVNGDGYSDVVIGDPGYDNNPVNEGRALVFQGSAGGLSTTPAWTTESNLYAAYFGNSVATAGDVNGDGYADVIIGAPGQQNVTGRAFVYHGGPTGLNPGPAWAAEGASANNGPADSFGWSAASAGDVNGDGYSDVIVGAYKYDPIYPGGEGKGRAFVYHGSSAGLSSSPAWITSRSNNVAAFGRSVDTAGDVNGDGYSDVIVGAPGEGRVFVYRGSSAGLTTSPWWFAENLQASAHFGVSVATAGDVNGDGYSDVIVGASVYDNGQTDEGSAFVYHGSATGLGAGSVWAAESNQAGALFGHSVASAGDVNGDGYADVIVGAYSYNNGQYFEGRAFVYYGNEGPGRRLNPQQRRSDNSRPIAPLGMSDSSVAFRLSALAQTPFGRSRVRLQWEVRPFGVAFTGNVTGQTAWEDTGVNARNIAGLASGLSSATNYHWRMRFRYHPAKTPFQQYSRWFTMPWNGWNEKDLRTP